MRKKIKIICLKSNEYQKKEKKIKFYLKVF